MSIGVGGAAAEAVVFAGFVESVSVEMALVEVDVAAVFEAEVGTACEDEGEVGVSVAVAIGHAATKEGHGRAEERLASKILGFGESGEEVAELFDGKGVVVGEFFHVSFITAVVAELVPGLGDADFRDGNGLTFSAKAEGSDTGHVCLESEDHEVVDGAKIVAGLRLGDISVGSFSVRVGDLGKGGVQPGIGPAGTNLCFADGGEVLVEASFVFGPHFLRHTAHFGEVVIEDAGFVT